MPQPPPDLVSWRPLSTPMGSMAIGIRVDGNLWTDWPDRFEHSWPDDALRDPECCPDAFGVLTRYFAGEAVDPAHAACPTPKGPPFHQAAWSACRSVPRGSTMTYGQLATLTGAPRAARAVGAAMRSNPLPLFIPCHRIISSSGAIGGFAGRQDRSSPAVRLKYDLLEFESAHADTLTPHADLMAASQGSHSCI